METAETVITLCMGSSCFSRGNNLNAEMIESYLADHGIAGRVEVRGCLCEGRCKDGPNIRINGQLLQGVRPGMLADLLDHTLAGGS